MNHWNFSNIFLALHGVQQQMLSVINKVHLLFKMKLSFLHTVKSEFVAALKL